MSAPAPAPAQGSPQPVAQPPTPLVAAAFVVKFGVTGGGKSVDDVMSFAGNGAYLAQPGALRGLGTVAAYPQLQDRVIHIENMEQANELLPQLAAAGWGAAILDDASLLMHNSMNAARERFKTVSKGGGEGIDREMWSYLRALVVRAAHTSRWLGIHVIWNCHEQPGFIDPKTREQYLAGPDFAWAKLVKIAPHEADLVMRVLKPDPRWKEWDTRCDCNESDPSSYQKDRFDRAIPNSGPLNTAEILRAAGYHIPRPVELGWMEEVAQSISDMMQQGANEDQARAPWKERLISAGVPLEHVRWALRDGVHRGRLIAHRRTSIYNSL